VGKVKKFSTKLSESEKIFYFRSILGFAFADADNFVLLFLGFTFRFFRSLLGLEIKNFPFQKNKNLVKNFSLSR